MRPGSRITAATTTGPAQGPRAGPSLAAPGAPPRLAPFRLVKLAAARGAHQRQNAAGAVGAVGLKPFGEEIADLERKPEQHIACLAYPGRSRALENALHLHIGEAGEGRGPHAG